MRVRWWLAFGLALWPVGAAAQVTGGVMAVTQTEMS